MMTRHLAFGLAIGLAATGWGCSFIRDFDEFEVGDSPEAGTDASDMDAGPDDADVDDARPPDGGGCVAGGSTDGGACPARVCGELVGGDGGVCVYEDRPWSTCDDGDSCTEGDVRVGGCCAGARIACDETAPSCENASTARVTTASCASGTCSESTDEITCSDGSTCLGGSCVRERCAGDEVNASNDTGKSVSPHVVWTGSEWGVVWANANSNPDDSHLFLRRIDDRPTLGERLQMDTEANFATGLDVVLAGGDFALVWSDLREGTAVGNQTYFGRAPVSDGMLDVDAQLTTASTGGGVAPDVAYNAADGEYGVVWEATTADGRRVAFARVQPDGSTMGGVQIVDAGCGPADGGEPSIAWTGEQWAIVWSDAEIGDGDIVLAMLASDGGHAGPAHRVSAAAGESTRPDIVWNGSDLAIAWVDARHGDTEIYFARFRTDGSRIGDEKRITTAAAASDRPSLLWIEGDRSEHVLVWQDARSGNDDVFFTRLDASGDRMVPDTRVTCQETDEGRPDVAWSGSELGFTWRGVETDEVYFWSVALE